MKNLLDITLEGDRTIVMRRTFTASRKLVFDAFIPKYGREIPTQPLIVE